MELSVNALGRNVSLGMLYDNRKDKFIEDQTLWNTDVIKQNTTNQILNLSSFELTSDDSIADKNMFLEISGSVKSSVLFNAYELTGSSSYLHNYREYSRQARVVCKYSSRNQYSEFLFREATARNQNQPAAHSASHFVSGIDYGADVIVVFELDVSNLRDYELEKATFQKQIFLWTSYENTSREITNITRNSSDVKFKIHGDIKLNSEPDTLEKAIELCKDLPKIVSKDATRKPMTIYLTPLSQILPEFSSASKNEPITEKVLTEVENILEKLHNEKIECNDLLAQPACTIDENLKNTLKEIQERITEDENELKSKLRLALHESKSTSANESIAVELNRYEGSADSPRREEALQELAIGVSVVNAFAKLVQNKAGEDNKGRANLGKSLNVKLPTSNSGNVSYRQKYKALWRMVNKINPDQISGDLKTIKITEDENIKEPTIDIIVDRNQNSNENATENDADSELDSLLLTDEKTDKGDANLKSSKSETPQQPNQQSSSTIDIICPDCGKRNCEVELDRRRRRLADNFKP